MEDILLKINEDVKKFMRDKDKESLSVLRMLKSSIKNFCIDSSDNQLSEESISEKDVILIISKEIKKRNDAVKQYEKAGRKELSEKERNEIEVLNRYLPEPLSEDETINIIKESIKEVGASTKKDVGKVINMVKEKAMGRVDAKSLFNLVSSQLDK